MYLQDRKEKRQTIGETRPRKILPVPVGQPHKGEIFVVLRVLSILLALPPARLRDT